jgi:hypothetical protein
VRIVRLAALLLVAPLAARAADCVPRSVPASRFAPGESLGFKLDVIGLDVGTFEITTELPPAADRPRAVLALKSRAKTTAFVSTNAGSYEAHATGLVDAKLAAVRYREELDEGSGHKAQEIDFPPVNGVLEVRSSKNGDPDPFKLAAGAAARDMLSTLFLLRAQPYGQPFCVEVLAGRKLWRVEGQAAARETIETPLGKFATLRVDLTAVRTDDVSVRRAAHVWVSDDARRLPLVALGEVKGKTIRAQLVTASALGEKKQARADHKRVGAAIGR